MKETPNGHIDNSNAKLVRSRHSTLVTLQTFRSGLKVQLLFAGFFNCTNTTLFVFFEFSSMSAADAVLQPRAFIGL